MATGLVSSSRVVVAALKRLPSVAPSATVAHQRQSFRGCLRAPNQACGFLRTFRAASPRVSVVDCSVARSSSSTSKIAPPVDGEWAFHASVYGNLGVLSGHLYLDPSGRAAYVADGVDVVGRGVGRWVTDGCAAALELDVYQYAVAAADIPEHPHRFRALWTTPSSSSRCSSFSGELHFLPLDVGESPRLVGSFVASTSKGKPSVSGSDGSDSQLPALVRERLMAALDEAPPLASPSAEAEARLEPFRIGDIPTVYYIPNWIDSVQERELIRHADVELNGWEKMTTRSTQEWGAGDRCVCGRGLTRDPLPKAHQHVADVLHQVGIFDGALYPMNSVRLNSYLPGQGIHPHCDGPVYYPKVGILSLNSPCIFSFYPRSGTEDCMKWDPANNVPAGFREGDRPKMSVLLEPRSLVVFGRDAFWHHRHGIADHPIEKVTEQVCNLGFLESPMRVGDEIKRARRVSLTMRHLLPRCACQG
eukprot:TRINITY_DN71076_c0_g1_i1.p1 TRINITY_DN71076_c0_g1~~TRINITY_DN71076_c0_g1_i1.p1  ORF type:complete len:484 (-),score=69.49 TRINITY_DN71076_c0_g1_i1:67-1494(-)